MLFYLEGHLRTGETAREIPGRQRGREERTGGLRTTEGTGAGGLPRPGGGAAGTGSVQMLDQLRDGRPVRGVGVGIGGQQLAPGGFGLVFALEVVVKDDALIEQGVPVPGLDALRLAEGLEGILEAVELAVHDAQVGQDVGIAGPLFPDTVLLQARSVP